MSPLRLVSLLIDIRALHQWAATRGFSQDEGCALHHLLSEIFGKSVLQPFRMMVAQGARQGSLYAYAHADEAELKNSARETGLPDALRVCAIDQLATKTMPETWNKGRRLAFDLRARPVRRLLKPAGDFAKGAEVDAFLADSLRASPERPSDDRLDRECVYRRWLEKRLAGAATVEQASLARYERKVVLRGGRRQEGPDVVWHGELTVDDGERFVEQIAGGVGRHSAYGYGMLLLRPARNKG